MTKQRTTQHAITSPTASLSSLDPGSDFHSARRPSDRIFVATSEASRRSLDQASTLARGDGAVVIVGDSGSGRKHFGRAIHAWSRRAGQPLVVFPVASTPDRLHERALFGTADGSETLSGDTAGYLAAAGSGTLLIDGLDKLRPAVRAALVQVLQSGAFLRSGETDPVRVEARILATANRDVEFVSPDKLLGDVPVETVVLQGLADRREDVLPLATQFLAEVSEEESIDPIGFTQDARDWLVEETWVGNVRELRERIRRTVRIGNSGVISAECLMLATDDGEVLSFKDAKRAFETRYVEGLLRRCNGNISLAARLAKKDRKNFYDVIRRTGVVPGEFRT